MRLVLSGGGTGGHIIPNIALIHELRERFPAGKASASATAAQAGEKPQLEILYIGGVNGMEQAMIAEIDVPFVAITCGKLRRYFSWKNFVDFFKVPVGIIQSLAILLKFRPDVIFCKGGFVSFPVAVAGWMLRIPVVLHESDVSPGLANSLCARFASVICVSFEESKKYFGKKKKTVVTGNPVRRELIYADKEAGLEFLHFTPALPVVLIMGGSSGAEFINKLAWRNLEYLLQHYQIAHLCGRNNVQLSNELLQHLKPEHHKNLSRYRAFEFLENELKDVYAAADVIVSRAGAISLAELDFFEKPVILIPLGTAASRGDQILNAEVFAKDHLAKVLHEGEFSDLEFMDDIHELMLHRKSSHVGHKKEDKFSALDKIIRLLQKHAEE
jgi:UDP-N-acetylglucosamine--N-acetylmuramyl-(pentapeptide) pyrophosphoryl-undecaprenol N-acetylglucosamine transferase